MAWSESSGWGMRREHPEEALKFQTAPPSATTHSGVFVPDSPLDPSREVAWGAPWALTGVLAALDDLKNSGTGRRLRDPHPQRAAATGSLSEAQRKILAERISRLYSIAPEAAAWIVVEAQNAADETEVDPVLLLAVVGVESRFNPYAGSDAGAMGFTQALPRAHPEAVAQIEADGGSILDPRANLRLGADVLKLYLTLQHGDRRRALQQYNGALGDETYGYASTVLRVYDRLKAPPFTAKNTSS